MKFWEAMKALEEDKNVKVYDDKGDKSLIFNHWNHRSIGHLMRMKWELYEEPQKTLSFMEAVALIKDHSKLFERKSNPKMKIGAYGENYDFFSCSAPIRIEDFEADDWVEAKT